MRTTMLIGLLCLMLTGCAGLRVTDETRKAMHETVDVGFAATSVLQAGWDDLKKLGQTIYCLFGDCPEAVPVAEPPANP